jgi:hypothetical protein
MIGKEIKVLGENLPASSLDTTDPTINTPGLTPRLLRWDAGQ